MKKQEFQGTKGGVKILMGNYGTFCTINKDSSTRIATINVGYGNVLDIVEATANANVMTEAINVAWETGLTPRELLKHRNELLKACQWALDQFKRLGDDGKYPEFMLQDNGGEGVMPLVNAINNNS